MLHSSTLQVKCNLLEGYLDVRWIGRQSASTIKAGYEQLLEILQQTYCCRILDDHRLIQGYWAEATDWFVLNWNPRAQQTGLLAHSVVYSDDFFSRHSTETLLECSSSGLLTGFETEEEARAFLLRDTSGLQSVSMPNQRW